MFIIIVFFRYMREAFLFGCFFGFARPRHMPFLGAPLLACFELQSKTVSERRIKSVVSIMKLVSCLGMQDESPTISRRFFPCLKPSQSHLQNFWISIASVLHTRPCSSLLLQDCRTVLWRATAHSVHCWTRPLLDPLVSSHLSLYLM